MANTLRFHTIVTSIGKAAVRHLGIQMLHDLILEGLRFATKLALVVCGHPRPRSTMSGANAHMLLIVYIFEKVNQLFNNDQQLNPFKSARCTSISFEIAFEHMRIQNNK